MTSSLPVTDTPQDRARLDRSAVGAGAPRGGRGRRIRASWIWFALPAILLAGTFFFVPQVLNLRFAFSSWTSFSPLIRWNGLDNFVSLIDRGLLTNAIQVTAGYAVVVMVVQNVVSMVLALALQDSTRVNLFFRSLFFVPVLLSPLAAGYIWRGMLAPDGPVNAVIGLVSPGFDWAWLGETSTALITVASIDAWKWIGLSALVYIAGLNSVPTEILEAARLDGASAWQRFWRIQLPLLIPSLTFNLTVSLVGAFSAYDVIMSTTSGGPGDSTRTLNVVLRNQWGQGFFGTGSALGLTVTVLVVAVAVPLVWWLGKKEYKA